MKLRLFVVRTTRLPNEVNGQSRGARYTLGQVFAGMVHCTDNRVEKLSMETSR